MTSGDHLDDGLLTWEEVRPIRDWRGLLLGNGASIAVWPGFAYSSIYQVATDQEGTAFSSADRELLKELDTLDFEAVLAQLQTASVVNRALSIEQDAVEQRYDSIRGALGAAVQAVHVPRGSVLDASLLAIRGELLNYNTVFSTNYDLLVYWAVLCQNPTGDGFKDYFWGPAPMGWGGFNLSDTEIGGGTSSLLYLHGGLHIYNLGIGRTAKRYQQDESLLDFFGTAREAAGALAPAPLFVAEGTSTRKIEAIARSPYLTFAYERMINFERPLVIFGHSLGEQDGHIVEAIRRSAQPLAISIHPDGSVADRKAHYGACFPQHDKWYFDSRTHPLGDPALRVEVGPT